MRRATIRFASVFLFIYFVVFEVIDRVFAVLLFVILMAATRPIVPHFEKLGEILCLGGFLFSQISLPNFMIFNTKILYPVKDIESLNTNDERL